MNVTYETYPDMFTDHENLIENENYDDEIRFFEIPEEWADGWAKEHGFTGLDEFNNEYTWDITYDMWEDAKAKGILISEHIDSRSDWGII